MLRLASVIVALLAFSSPASAQGFICAEGGGNANKGAWADEVFGWMVEKGDRGPVVIIGAVPLEQDDRPALFKRLGAASASSLVIDASNADTQQAHDAITAARIVFIRGGAQDRYVRFWKGTATQRAIIEVYRKGGVIGGTSAGCAILGEVAYDALHGSLSAREALEDARHEHLSLTTNFLDLVPGVLFDSHFTERARLARLPVMLAHARQDLHRDHILGIGVDPRTAVCIGPDHIAEIRGEGTATFLSLADDSRIALDKAHPPTVTAIAYTQLCAGYRYDLTKREVVFRPDSVHAVPPPAPLELPTRSLSVGDDPHDPAGAFAWKASSDNAWMTGEITVVPGRAIFRDLIAVTCDWANRPANAIAGAQITLAEHPGQIAIWQGSPARLDPRGWLDVPTGKLITQSILVLSSRSVTHAGRGPVPRRAPVLEAARLDLLAPGWALSLTDRLVAPPAPPEPVTPGD